MAVADPGRTVFRQRWTTLTYLHWPYDPDVIRPHLPAGTQPDLFDGAAWVGLIPFAMRDIRILGAPVVPYLGAFLETNVRTYAVDGLGRSSVVFLSLDASRLLPVLAARATYRLPYRWAAMSLEEVDEVVTYRCRRRWPGAGVPSSRITVRTGPVLGEPVPLDRFLTDRWGLHTRWWRGRTQYAPVQHEAWPLHAAELLDLDDGLVTAAGLPAPTGEPRVLWSPGVSVRIGRPR